MNTPMPAKTNVPPKKPSTRTTIDRARLLGAAVAGDAGAPSAAATSPAVRPCCRTSMTISSSARVRGSISVMSAWDAARRGFEPAEEGGRRVVNVLGPHRQLQRDDPTFVHERRVGAVAAHPEQLADEATAVAAAVLQLIAVWSFELIEHAPSRQRLDALRSRRIAFLQVLVRRQVDDDLTDVHRPVIE